MAMPIIKRKLVYYNLIISRKSVPCVLTFTSGKFHKKCNGSNVSSQYYHHLYSIVLEVDVVCIASILTSVPVFCPPFLKEISLLLCLL